MASRPESFDPLDICSSASELLTHDLKCFYVTIHILIICVITLTCVNVARGKWNSHLNSLMTPGSPVHQRSSLFWPHRLTSNRQKQFLFRLNRSRCPNKSNTTIKTNKTAQTVKQFHNPVFYASFFILRNYNSKNCTKCWWEHLVCWICTYINNQFSHFVLPCTTNQLGRSVHKFKENRISVAKYRGLQGFASELSLTYCIFKYNG